MKIFPGANFSQSDAIAIVTGWGTTNDPSYISTLANNISDDCYGGLKNIIADLSLGIFGLINAKKIYDKPLVASRRLTDATQKQPINY